MMTLTLYSRRACPLCDDMVLDLEMAARGREIHVDVVDVDTDPALVDRYGLKVPVLCHDDTEVCHGQLDAAALNRYLHSVK